MARKILLADDSVTAQNMGRRILADAGYEVVTVNNGSAALKKIAEQRPEMVVLDVYMPGYNGLEVCQRIKEDPETADIPVLLTVGKLEPFKADDARRVHAEAHIIKPFEATELLAVLSRLEEKIVVRHLPAKSLRPVKGGKKGDSQAAGKNGLKLHHSAKADKTDDAAASPGFRDFRAEIAKSEGTTAELEAALPPNLPPDVTAEEIAAITAAAAAFGFQAEDGAATEAELSPEELVSSLSVPEALVEQPQPAEPEWFNVEVSQAAVPEVEAAAIPEAVSFAAEPVAEQSPAAIPESIAEPVAELTPEPSSELVAAWPAEAVEMSAIPAPEVAEVLEPEHLDSEVASALAFLTPVGGETPAPTWTPQYSGYAESGGNGTAWASEAPRPGLSCWIAQELPVTPEEVALILEDEMQNAYAMLSSPSAEYAVQIATHIETPTLTEEVPAPEFMPSVVDAVSSIEAEAVSSEAFPEEVVAASQVHEALPEPEPEPAPEMPAVAAIEEAPASTDFRVIAAYSQEHVEAAESLEQAAEAIQPEVYAAAAAAGQDAPSASASAAAAPQPVIEEPAAAPDSLERAEAGLADAWARWRQIREAVASPNLASQITDAAIAEIKESQQEAAAEASHSTPAAPAADSAAIASIVDSVLAQLKPKLVEEIARQLGEKKK